MRLWHVFELLLISGESNEPMPAQTHMQSCNNQVCEVRRDRPAVVEITLKAQRPTSSIHGSVQIYYQFRWWTVNIGEQANVCSHLISGRCPLATGAQATFRGQLDIPKFARIGQKAPVRIRGVDQDKRPVACVKILAKVVAWEKWTNECNDDCFTIEEWYFASLKPIKFIHTYVLHICTTVGWKVCGMKIENNFVLEKKTFYFST